MMRNETKNAAQRMGMTLIEVMAALIIAATVAAFGLQYLRPAGESSRQRSCDLARQLLQSDVQRYTEATGGMPSRDLSELRTAEYSGSVLPSCPTTGQAYRLDRSGIVGCPTHEATRER